MSERDYIAVRELRAGHFVPATEGDKAACDAYGIRPDTWGSYASAAAAITRAGFVARHDTGKPDELKPRPKAKAKIAAAPKPVALARSKIKHETREAWLLAAIEQMRPLFDEKGKPLPATIRASCGFALGSRKAIGQAWGSGLCNDGVPAVFVSPVVGCEVRALDILLHELVHVALPPKTGHKAPFAKLAADLGLVKPWTATTASPELRKRLNTLADKLGSYPHAALNVSDRKKQGTRLLKAQCTSCGYTVRITAKWLNDVGEPHCPMHGEMECA